MTPARTPRVHQPPRLDLSREAIVRTTACPVCKVAAGEKCIRVRRQDRQPVVRERNHLARLHAHQKRMRSGG